MNAEQFLNFMRLYAAAWLIVCLLMVVCLFVKGVTDPE